MGRDSQAKRPPACPSSQTGASCGIMVGHVVPEAHRGGAIAHVRDGDTVVYNLDSRSLDVDVSAYVAEKKVFCAGREAPSTFVSDARTSFHSCCCREEFERRKADWTEPALKCNPRSWLGRYAKQVTACSRPVPWRLRAARTDRCVACRSIRCRTHHTAPSSTRLHEAGDRRWRALRQTRAALCGDDRRLNTLHKQQRCLLPAGRAQVAFTVLGMCAPASLIRVFFHLYEEPARRRAADMLSCGCRAQKRGLARVCAFDFTSTRCRRPSASAG